MTQIQWWDHETGLTRSASNAIGTRANERRPVWSHRQATKVPRAIVTADSANHTAVDPWPWNGARCTTAYHDWLPAYAIVPIRLTWSRSWNQ